MRIKIKNSEIYEALVDDAKDFPKYTTQIMNLANQNAQGTRPSVVGQLSDMIQEFPGKTIREWEMYYLKQRPDSIEFAVEKIFKMIQELQRAIKLIDKDMVNEWVQDLIINKTYIGFKFQDVVLSKVAVLKDSIYKRSEPKEEARGIDGYIGDRPVSVKPHTYKSQKRLREDIQVSIVYYEKRKDGIVVECEDL